MLYVVPVSNAVSVFAYYNDFNPQVAMVNNKSVIVDAYCSYETCKLLKEKGFNIPVCTQIHKDFKDDRPDTSIWRTDRPENFNDTRSEGFYSCPTHQMAMCWLRKEYNLHVCPEYKAFFQERPRKLYYHWCCKIVCTGVFRQGISEMDVLDSDYFFLRSAKTYHDTYEDACEECIEFALRYLIAE